MAPAYCGQHQSNDGRESVGQSVLSNDGLESVGRSFTNLFSRLQLRLRGPYTGVTATGFSLCVALLALEVATVLASGWLRSGGAR